MSTLVRPGKNATRRDQLAIRLVRHHLPLGAATLAFAAGLYLTRPYRDWVTRASFASAYPALVLLAVTLWLGPWNVLRRQKNPVSSDLRRDIGIWAGIVGVVHAAIGQCVHLRGRPWLYYVYERREHHAIPLRHDWFGFANESGFVATLVLLALLATSNDRSLRAMGTPQWKRLQRWNYACFALAGVHTLLYQSNESLHVQFFVITIGSLVITLGLQIAGVVLRRSAASGRTVPA